MSIDTNAVLGTGTIGTVYEATWKDEDGTILQVAAKVSVYGTDMVRKQELIREAEFLRELNNETPKVAPKLFQTEDNDAAGTFTMYLERYNHTLQDMILDKLSTPIMPLRDVRFKDTVFRTIKNHSFENQAEFGRLSNLLATLQFNMKKKNWFHPDFHAGNIMLGSLTYKRPNEMVAVDWGENRGKNNGRSSPSLQKSCTDESGCPEPFCARDQGSCVISPIYNRVQTDTYEKKLMDFVMNVIEDEIAKQNEKLVKLIEPDFGGTNLDDLNAAADAAVSQANESDDDDDDGWGTDDGYEYGEGSWWSKQANRIKQFLKEHPRTPSNLSLRRDFNRVLQAIQSGAAPTRSLAPLLQRTRMYEKSK